MKLSERLNDFRHTITVRKIVLILILAVCLIFIFTQRNSFLTDRSYLYDDGNYHITLTKDNKISMKGNTTVRQGFTAQENRIHQVRLVFNNPGKYSSTGTLDVRIEDSNGKTVARSKLETNLIANNSVTRFSFVSDSKALNSNVIVTSLQSAGTSPGINVTKGKKYTLVAETSGVDSEQPFDICLLDGKTVDGNALSVDGTAYKGEHIYSVMDYKYFSFTVFTFFILCILAAVILILLPLGKIQESINIKRRRAGKKDMALEKLLLRIMFFLTPPAAFYIISKITGLTTMTTIVQLLSFKGLLNMMIIGLVWWLIYVCCNRVKYTIIATTAAAFTFGLINYMMLQFRDSPLIATDITSVGTGLSVLGTYHLTFDKACLWAIMLTVIWICLALSMKSHKGLPPKKRIAAVLLLAAWGFTFNYVMFQSSVLRDHKIGVSGFKPKFNYKNNGYVLSFFVTVSTSRVEKPDDYSVEKVKKITADYRSDTAVKLTKTTEKSPNVVVVMDEAFSDLRAVGDFSTNTEYMPFYNSLKTDTVKGTMHTSIFGGSTAVTEFEFLTGFSVSHLPFHSIPYAGMIKEKTPSLTWDLRAQGYGGNIAFHPGMANSYNRDKVYPDLGFEKHISLEDMDDPEKIRAYVSDEEDFSTVEKEYEKYKSTGSSDPFYLFNVTIQNHGGYKLSSGAVNAGISITDDTVREEEAEQYLNLIKKSDEALEGLISYFQSVDEPTIVVLFGDHQPRVGSSFYSSLDSSSKGLSDLERIEKRYQVPFMIWANYDIKEKENVQISANYLSSYMLQQTGGKMTGYNKYLMELYKTLPVTTAICTKDADGNIYDAQDKTKYSKLLEEYKTVQYNGFMDHKNRLDDFFYLK